MSQRHRRRAAKARGLLTDPRNADRFLRDIGAGKPGGGVVAMRVIRGIQVLDALLRDHIDIEALRILQCIPEWLRMTSKAEPGRGPLCLTCDIEFSRQTPPPVAFVLTTPHFKDPASEMSVLLTGVCLACARQSDDDLLAVARRHWLTSNPGARELPPEGHA
jgi:hypothetical protein